LIGIDLLLKLSLSHKNVGKATRWSKIIGLKIRNTLDTTKQLQKFQKKIEIL
jgi:hypothetical protein